VEEVVLREASNYGLISSFVLGDAVTHAFFYCQASVVGSGGGVDGASVALFPDPPPPLTVCLL